MRETTRHSVPQGWKTARAPYNFVRLPQQILPATKLLPAGKTPWASHDRYDPDLLTGYLTLRITTLTPLFLGPAKLPDPLRPGTFSYPTASDGALQSFRLTHDGEPMIPASSIAGMLNTIVRILTFSRPGETHDPTLWFRQPVAKNKHRPSESRLTRYLKLLGDDGPPPKGPATAVGFLRRREEPDKRLEGCGDRWVIEPAPAAPIGKPSADPPWKRACAHTVRHDVIHAAFPKWHEPGNDIKYRPSKHNQETFQREVLFYSCTLTIPGPVTLRNVVIGIAPADDPGARKTLDAQQHADFSDVKVPDRARWGMDTRDRVQDAAGPGIRVLKVEGLTKVHRGVLVLTGVTGDPRSKAHVFRTDDPACQHEKNWLPVDNDIVAAVDSDHQISRWQQDNFLMDVPHRTAKGRLRDGDPVWFHYPGSGSGADDRSTVQNPPVVTSFGRAGGYRLPYPNTRDALLPEDQRRPANLKEPIDVSQAMFGDVVADGAMRGRVRFGHGVLVDPPAQIETGSIRVQLLEPKRTTFAHYLTQGSATATDLRSYDSTETEPRGFKLYLHRWNPMSYAHLIKAEPEGETVKPIQPLNAGLTFESRVTFTNLSEAELGVLLRALTLGNSNNSTGPDPGDPPAHAHKLGRGKPLGLGSIHITPELTLIDTSVRYTQPGGGTAHPTDVSRYLTAFDETVRAHARQSTEGTIPGDHTWAGIARLQELLCATRWAERCPPTMTEPMPLNDKTAVNFADNPVLPGILTMFGLTEDAPATARRAPAAPRITDQAGQPQ